MPRLLTLDLLTFDPGAKHPTPSDYVRAVEDLVLTSWDSGADVVLLPEFTWMGLEPLLEADLTTVARVFWQDLFPTLQARLQRPEKAVVLGTAPYFAPSTQTLHNRAPILNGLTALHQDKLHLTPWEQAFTAGQQLTLWQHQGLRIATVICLDIEIPELSARLRDHEVDLILCPSATETLLGVERVDRCASARAVELGCYVGVSHLTGTVASELVDVNVGRCAFYRPSQSCFGDEPRWIETAVFDQGHHSLRVTVNPRALQVQRRFRRETNPSLLGKDIAGLHRPISVISPESPQTS